MPDIPQLTLPIECTEQVEPRRLVGLDGRYAPVGGHAAGVTLFRTLPGETMSVAASGVLEVLAGEAIGRDEPYAVGAEGKAVRVAGSAREVGRMLAAVEAGDTGRGLPTARGAPPDLSGYVKRSDLEGAERDRFASWQDATAFLSDLSRRGEWGISADEDGTPRAANFLERSEIVSGGPVTLYFGAQLRDDPDPDVWSLAPAAAAADYPAGTVLYISPWAPYDPANHIRVTLTGDAILTGEGDAAYLHAPVAIVEVGDLSNVGGFYRLSEIAPSGLDVKVPSSAVVAAPWALTTLANIGNLAAAGVRQIVKGFEALTGEWLTRLRRIVQGNNEAVSLRLTRSPTSPPASAGEIFLPQNLLGNALVVWPATDKDGAALPVADMLAYVEGDHLDFGSARLVLTTGVTKFLGNVYQFGIAVAPGYVFNAPDLPAVNAAADATFEGRDVHLGLIVRQILKRAAVNIGGKGRGAAGAYWKAGNSDSNAGWGTPRAAVRSSDAADGTLPTERAVRLAMDPAFAAAASGALDGSARAAHKLTLAANTVLSVTSPGEGALLRVLVVQQAGNSYTLTLDAGIDAGGNAISAPAAGKSKLLEFLAVGGGAVVYLGTRAEW